MTHHVLDVECGGVLGRDASRAGPAPGGACRVRDVLEVRRDGEELVLARGKQVDPTLAYMRGRNKKSQRSSYSEKSLKEYPVHTPSTGSRSFVDMI
jgi:hypothetical protein